MGFKNVDIKVHIEGFLDNNLSIFICILYRTDNPNKT